MEELNATHFHALTLLVAGYTAQEVAEKTDVSIRTIQRWKQRSDFRALLTEGVSKTFDSAIAELVAGSRTAVQELKRIISDPDVAPKTKISAINTLLVNAARAKDAALEERLHKIERILDGTDPGEAPAD